MERMPICRICLVENVPMYIVADNELHEFYETLTNIPFVTEDRRPLLTCYFCFAKLKQCSQLQRKCLEAEELFAQMMNEPNTSVNRGQLEFFSGLTKTPVEIISIVDVSQIESIAVKEEIPDACERLDDVIELDEEHQSDGAPVAKNPQFHLRRTELEDIITEDPTKNEQLDTKVTKNSQNGTSKTVTKYNESLTYTKSRVNNTNKRRIHAGEKPFKCNICQRCFRAKSTLKNHIRIHAGDKSFKCEICQRCFCAKSTLTNHIRMHAGETPFKCDICQRCFMAKSTLINHVRIHTVEKQFKCDFCQRCFSQKRNFTHHIRLHTGEKPFKCDVCQRCFSAKIRLTNHICSHTAEKPF